MVQKKNNLPKRNGHRFLILTEAAAILGTSVSSVSRKLGGDIPGGEMQVFIKEGEAYFPVGETKIKVVDVSLAI